MIINGRRVGADEKPLVIVEIGINHGGSLKVALKMVDDAFSAGAEVIKHQTHIIEDEMSKEAKKVIREHLGVSSKCIECNKFLLNPRHNYCRKHNPSVGRRSSSSSRRSSSSSSKFSSKTCKQCKKNKVDEFENNFQLCKKCFGMRGKGAYDPTFSDWYTGDDIK